MPIGANNPTIPGCGSHQAGQETFCPLVNEAVSKLLARHAGEGVQQASLEEPADGDSAEVHACDECGCFEPFLVETEHNGKPYCLCAACWRGAR